MPVAAVSSKEILQATQIPSIPATLNDILKAAGAPGTTSSTLEKLVLKDANVSVRILKTVNSALYALPQRVSSIGQAVVLLGFPAVKSVASSLVMLETFGKMPGMDQTYLVDVWRHSLLTSRIVGLFAAKESKVRRDELQLAATVHDVGHLILVRHFESKYPELMKKHGRFPSAAAEIEALGIDHATLGADLLADWHFAPTTQALVRTQHAPPAAPGAAAGPTDHDYLHAADAVSEAVVTNPDVFKLSKWDAPGEVTESILALGLSWADLQARAKVILEAHESTTALLQG